MSEQWHYYVAFLVQLEPGRVGISARPVNMPMRITSFDALGILVMNLEKAIFPEGTPDLPDGLLPIVPLFWHLLTAKQGPGVKPRDDGDTT